TQFLTLRFWGKVGDNFGNRLVMVISSVAIPIIPILWLFSADHYYLLVVQMVSGVAWSGFSLSTANYLYDIRPHRSDFAVYAAMQSALSACAVFVGAIIGGVVASMAPRIVAALPVLEGIRSPLFIVFVVTCILRAAVALWF